MTCAMNARGVERAGERRLVAPAQGRGGLET